MLAYLGLALGHRTIAEAMADERCVSTLESLWSEAEEVLPFDANEIANATQALRERFTNARIQHQLAQIAWDLQAASEGRFSTRPAAPCSPCSVTSTTVRRKFGSSSDGDAMRRAR